MSNTIDEFRALLHKIEPALAVIQVAQQVIGLGGVTAEKALAAIAAAVKAFEDGSTGVITSDEATGIIDAIRTAYEGRDASEDAKLKERFPEGG